MRKMAKKFKTQAINDDILEAMSLKNRYKFLNNNLMIILTPEQFSWLREVERFCERYDKKVTHGPEEDVYDWIPDFGKKGYICRSHSFDVID